jgi:hypothetical protein
MKHLLLTVALLFSSTSFASTGSLWCALSSYGTPTETAEASALAYELVQIDKMSGTTIQVSIDDIYNETSKVFEAELKSANGSISDIAIGKYSKNVEVKVKDGKILVLNGSRTYKCEIPGDYQTDYASYVK